MDNQAPLTPQTAPDSVSAPAGENAVAPVKSTADEPLNGATKQPNAAPTVPSFAPATPTVEAEPAAIAPATLVTDPKPATVAPKPVAAPTGITNPAPTPQPTAPKIGVPVAEARETSRIGNVIGRIAGFCAVATAIWGGYFLWRPPQPTLYLKHIEKLNDEQHLTVTFDDAPHPLSTPLLLASLKRADVKATFFVVGEGLRLYPELAYRMVAEGHSLANHSENHRNLTRADVPVSDYDMEVKQCFSRIQALGQNTRLFRPPGGGMNREVMDYLYRNDYTLAWWSNNIGDWARPPAWKIVDQVKLGVRPGDVILLHDAGIGTAQALPSIVRASRDQNLQFIPMPER